MNVANYFLNFIMQMVFTLGVIFLFGAVISLCNGAFYRNLGRRAHTVCLVTGFIGTPVHECSHAIACLIFGHKIIKIKFYEPDAANGVLGYVQHTYNRKSLYQRIGNLFIGIAPIIIGALILAGLLYLLLPELFSSVSSEIAKIDLLNDFWSSLGHIWRSFAAMFSYVGAWQWWIFVLAGSFIATHMTLSRADIKGALSGLVVYVALFLIADLVLILVSENALAAFTGAVVAGGTFMLFFFCIFLVISLILLALSFITRGISRARR